MAKTSMINKQQKEPKSAYSDNDLSKPCLFKYFRHLCIRIQQLHRIGGRFSSYRIMSALVLKSVRLTPKTGVIGEDIISTLQRTHQHFMATH